MFTSKHRPHSGVTPHFDNHKLEGLLADYQRNGDLESLSAIVNLAQPRAQTLIRFYKTTRYRREDELLSDVNLKLLRAVNKFDPAKGLGKNQARQRKTASSVKLQLSES
jgi:hypothetical protein